MAERLILHIGAMKTGTSFLQSVLQSNQAAHDRAGYRFLSTFGTQSSGVRAVLTSPNTPERHGAWRALIEEARRFEGEAAIVSMEFLSFARRHQVDAFLRGTEGLDVQVVATVRDQFRALPGQWQSFTRNQGTDPWARYLRLVDPARQRPGEAESRAARAFRRAQDIPRILRRWSGHPGVSRTDVIVVPSSSAPRDQLWRLFTGAVGMPADRAERLDEVSHNASLGYASCRALRLLNTHLQDHPPRVYRTGMRPLVREALMPRRGLERRPTLDRGAAAFARTANGRIRAELADTADGVHGSLDDLPVPDVLPQLPRRAEGPDPKRVREAAAALWDRCAHELEVAASRRPRRLAPQLAEIAEMAPRTAAWRAASQLMSPGPS